MKNIFWQDFILHLAVHFFKNFLKIQILIVWSSCSQKLHFYLFLWSVQKRQEWINLILLLSCLQPTNLRCLPKSVLWSETIFRKILMEHNGFECKEFGSIDTTKELKDFVQDLQSILQQSSLSSLKNSFLNRLRYFSWSELNLGFLCLTKKWSLVSLVENKKETG